MRKTKIIIGLFVTVLLTLALVLPAAAQVKPPVVTEDLKPGESMTVIKEVTTPTLLPTADVVISVDLTGSMGGALANLKTEIGNIITALSGASADLNVGIVSHEDYPDYYESCDYANYYGDPDWGDEAFRVDYAVGGDFAAASAAVLAMTLKNGMDGPESYARVMWESGQSDSGIGYRAKAQKILVMFLDNVPHDCDLLGDGTVTTGVDPGRNATAGDGDDIDLQDDAILAMTGAGITLLVVSSGSAATTALWDDIAGETGGSAVQINSDGTVPGGISLTDLILELIQEIKTDVWWEVTADDGLTVTLNPAVHEDVAGNTTVRFLETITIDQEAPPCGAFTATVVFIANKYPEEGVVIGEQKIRVGDITPPEVWCEESVNPHGKNVPGKNRSDNAKDKAKNPDGFYQLFAEDNCDPEPDIFVSCEACADAFGPFASGIVVKLTEAPGAAPSCKKIGSSKGQAGAVLWHITLPSDPVIIAIDASGNMDWCRCLVPPPPK